LPDAVRQNIGEDPYADIRKFTKFNNQEELVRFMVQMRDEGF
jgi:hypothetical protein